MSVSKSKAEKDLLNKFIDLLKKNKDKIINWLDDIGKNRETYIDNNSVPSLFREGKKIDILAKTETAQYNLILKFIKENIDQFSDYNFSNIPDSNFTIISDNDQGMGAARGSVSREPRKTYITIDDVKRWASNPLEDPISGKKIKEFSNSYVDYYYKGFDIIMNENKKILSSEGIEKIKTIIYNTLPREHLLFNNAIDLLFIQKFNLYNEKNKKNFDPTMPDSVKGEYLYRYDGFDYKSYIANLFDISFDTDADTLNNIVELEIELLKALFDNKKKLKYTYDTNATRLANNILNTEKIFTDYFLINIDTEKIKKREIVSLINELSNYDNPYYNYYRRSISFKILLDDFKLSNGKKIYDYLVENRDVEEFKTGLDIYDRISPLYKEIDEFILNKNENIDNYEMKEYKKLDDPIDDLFKGYEEKLKIFTEYPFNQLINTSTYQPIDKKLYLNDEQKKNFDRERESLEKSFKKEHDEYVKKLQKYRSLKPEERSKSKSPSPPKIPMITLPSKQKFILSLQKGKDNQSVQKSPKHVPDKIVKEFEEKYKQYKDVIKDYNLKKEMGYLELLREFKKSSPPKDISSDNKLLSLKRSDFESDILYDYTDLEDKCNDSNDMLTNEDFSDDNYPLAKLQLMVRLKIPFKKTDGTESFKTECYYAPRLYNYYVETVNKGINFTNPLTRRTYTEEHINELMKVIRLIKPDIERPIKVKPINDKKLEMTIEVVHGVHNDPSIFNGIYSVEFAKIKVIRKLHPNKAPHEVFTVCVIPLGLGVGSDATFNTQSADLNSESMIFTIHKLFNEGKLLKNYLPPYFDREFDSNGREHRTYISLLIHFNKYKYTSDWLVKEETRDRRLIFKNTEEFIDMFKTYASEINNYAGY